ncbi:hypothetical protein EVAR_30709_1 [Eumeta japonica]|uniref:Uncharacterized protein n=1 Tax=Eumeta variegata TaxID=151549 RepID=A0A4C1V5Q0_EUMVA|nr:hypothetical protein EVAR_30709_1 [Eumeta japonica]
MSDAVYFLPDRRRARHLGWPCFWLYVVVVALIRCSRWIVAARRAPSSVACNSSLCMLHGFRGATQLSASHLQAGSVVEAPIGGRDIRFFGRVAENMQRDLGRRFQSRMYKSYQREQEVDTSRLSCFVRAVAGGGCVYSGILCTDRMRTGKRNRHRRPDSPDPNPKSKRDDISINQLT